jgi:hypothetical protein
MTKIAENNPQCNANIGDEYVLANRFSYNLEECINAKNKLIELGFKKENDFYYHDSAYSDSYMDGEPMLSSGDDDCVSALDSYNSYLNCEEEGILMADFYNENGLL